MVRMAGFVPLSQRVGYTTAQIQLLFGHSDGRGHIVPLHECTIRRWRQSGAIPFVKINQRTFRYPRAQIDAILHARRERADEMVSA